MGEYSYDLIVVGAGPGGYVGAIRAAQLGLRVLLVEEKEVGGVCLNEGCIPSKTLIEQAKLYSSLPDLKRMGIEVNTSGFTYASCYEETQRVVARLVSGIHALLKKHRVKHIKARGQIQGPHSVLAGGEVYSGRFLLLATGSESRGLPDLPFDGEHVLSSTDALALRELPSSGLIVGSGAIGLEFAYIWNALGVEVTVLEKASEILPSVDRELVSTFKGLLEKKRDNFLHWGDSAKGESP